jgi:hypothetical protein
MLYRLNASNEYTEQDGSKRQLLPKYGDKVF